MSGATVEDFIGYWENEGLNYVRHGDYEWMASLVPGQRVLEIGCGVGYGTESLLKRGLVVLAIDSLPECLQSTQSKTRNMPGLTLLQAEISHLESEQQAQIEAFTADTVVCWLMGAPAETTKATVTDAGQAVAAYREKIHRLVAELAAKLPSVKYLHFVDRTAIPWQAKDIGRETLVRYHSGKTLLDLPWTAEKKNALYRKLGDNVVDIAQIRKSHPSLKSVSPTLASLLAERKS